MDIRYALGFAFFLMLLGISISIVYVCQQQSSYNNVEHNFNNLQKISKTVNTLPVVNNKNIINSDDVKQLLTRDNLSKIKDDNILYSNINDKEYSLEINNLNGNKCIMYLNASVAFEYKNVKINGVNFDRYFVINTINNYNNTPEFSESIIF